jgi:hypothetical protein
MKNILISIGIFIVLLFNGSELTDNIFFRLSPFIYYIIIIIIFNKTLVLPSIRKICKFYNLASILFILVLIISIFRSENPDFAIINQLSKALYLVLFLLFNYQLLLNGSKKNNLLSVIQYGLFYPLGLFSILNLLLWFLGFSLESNLEIGSSVLLSQLIGKTIPRVTFPLGSGAVNFGLQLGTLLISSYALLKYYSRLYILGVIFSVVLLLINDSRAIIMSCVLILALQYFRNLQMFLLKLVPLFILLGPFILVGSVYVMQYFDLITILSRSSTDLETGNSRFLIWLVSLNEFITPKIDHLFGYGMYGTYTSGASKYWANNFTSFENPLLTTAHNTFLSILYDVGYVGVTLLIYLLSKSCKKIYFTYKNNLHQPVLSTCASVLLLYSFAGVTDITISLYTANNCYIFFLIVSLINITHNDNRNSLAKG